MIYEVAALNDPQGSFPGAPAAMKAAARAINAAGGVNGHPIEIQTCNGSTDPNLEVQCARKAVASNAVDVSGSFFVGNPAGDTAILKAAGLPALGNNVATFDEISSTIDFPIDSGPFNPFGCIALPKAGVVKKYAIVASDLGPIVANAKGVQAGAAASGATISTNITLPQAPDVSAQIQQVTNSGADGVLMFALPPQAVQVLAASASLGKKLTFCTSDGLVLAGQLAQLGPAASNFYLASNMPPVTDTSNPGIAKFLSDMKAEAASGDSDAKVNPLTYSSTTLRSWAAVVAFAQVAKTITGPITRASFLAALKSSTAVSTDGVFPPINFTKSVSTKYPSIYNTSIQILKWDPSKKQFDPSTLTYSVPTSLLDS